MKTTFYKQLEETHKYPEAHTWLRSTDPQLKIPALYLALRFWFLITTLQKKKPGFHRVMADSRTEQGKIQDNLEYLVMPKNKEVLKR